MDRWEYEVKELFGPWTTESVEEAEAISAAKENLNRLGGEGWELVSVVTHGDRPSGIEDYYMILKRRAAA